jgi:hypothetical protein
MHNFQIDQLLLTGAGVDTITAGTLKTLASSCRELSKREYSVSKRATRGTGVL